MQAKVIHAYKKWEEINRDLLELSKLKERISDEREYSGFLKESFQREIEKLSGYKESLLKLKVQSDSMPAPSKPSTDQPGQKLYQENETNFREEMSNAPTNTTPTTTTNKKKTERPVYKY